MANKQPVGGDIEEDYLQELFLGVCVNKAEDNSLRYYAKNGTLVVGVLPTTNRERLWGALKKRMVGEPQLRDYEIRFKVLT